MQAVGFELERLEELPEAMARMEGLETLDLYNNELRGLGVRFDEFKRLKKVYVKDSEISAPEIGRLRKSLLSVEFTEEMPKELYLQLH